MKYIDECNDLKGKKVLLRLDLNVPIQDGVVSDSFRIDRIIETIDFLRDKEAQIIILSHVEHNGSTEARESLVPVLDYLNGYFPVQFSKNYFTPEAIDLLLTLQNRDVILFENLRMHPEEKLNSEEFSKKISQMGDIYVNDAFAVCHRNHASIVGVPAHLPSYGGLLLKKEIEYLSQAFKPQKPFIFILGGAKFETKLQLINKYLNSADSIFVGGALAHNIFKQKGFEIGTSYSSEKYFNLTDIIENKKLYVPIDVTTINTGDEHAIQFKKTTEVEKDECIVDAGPDTIENIKYIIADAKTIVWNGPIGNYEKGFSDKTEQLAELIAKKTEDGTQTIVGGEDTVASIKKMNLEESFSFISTGGEAMMDFLLYETLPGIEALKK